jgi:hypothetical protein
MSSTERQREFRARHPGYDRRRKAKERAAVARVLAQREAQRLAAMVETANAEVEALQLLRIPIPTTRYALPAPVECLTMAAINALVASKDSLRAAVGSRV